MASKQTEEASGSQVRIIEVLYPSNGFDAVEKLWRRNRGQLGFMPTEGFKQRADRGTLLTAVQGDEVLGYVLFDLPGNEVKIIHLCVTSSARRGGVGRLLVEKVSRLHRGRRGIRVTYRRDYDAGAFWQRVGFVPVDERRGRGHEKRPLTIGFYDHGHHNLFQYRPGYHEGDRVAVALDHNVVVDLVTKRPQGLESRHLLEDWVKDRVILCITDESYREVDQIPDTKKRNKYRGQLSLFAMMPAKGAFPAADWEALFTAVASLVPGVGEADHNHLTYSIAGKASYFVTRDDKILRCTEAFSRRFGIEIMRPAQLIVELDRLGSEDRYSPSALNATEIGMVSDVESEQKFLQAFLNYGDAERSRELAQVLRRAQSDPQRFTVEVAKDDADRYLGCVIAHIDGEVLVVDALRVLSANRVGHAMARQLCFLQRKRAADLRIPRVEVLDPHPSPAVVEALNSEGFSRQEPDAWICSAEVGILDGRTKLSADGVTPADAALYESRNWPAKVIGVGLETFVVPIRPDYAAQLFDTQLASETLFGRETGLGLSREHIYYRSPQNSRGIAAPARILWYVSGRTPSQTQGHLRALSQLVETAVERPQTAFGRFQRLGVYSRDQVAGAADQNGKVMALRFVNTELFEDPMSLDQAREIAVRLGKSFTPLPAPQPVSERFFVEIYRQASNYGR